MAKITRTPLYQQDGIDTSVIFTGTLSEAVSKFNSLFNRDDLKHKVVMSATSFRCEDTFKKDGENKHQHNIYELVLSDAEMTEYLDDAEGDC